MSKTLKIILIVLGVLIILAVAAFIIAFPKLKEQTKKASPEQVVSYEEKGLDLEVYYNRPSKRGRDIFAADGLVPYGQVWRTGANEATTFETAKDINVGGEKLAAGKYTLWTIPDEKEWTIIFNSKMYGWGVSFSAKASVKREHDVMNLKVPVEKLSSEVEMFTIAFEDGDQKTLLTLSWDDVKVSLPITP